MSITVKIEFGGLCLFVQRDSAADAGLWVLMPHFTGHCPMLIAPFASKPGYDRTLFPIEHGTVVLWKSSWTTYPKVALNRDKMFHASLFGGNKRVDETLFTNPMDPRVTALVRMPLWASVKPNTDHIGDIFVVDHGTFQTTGSVYAEFRIPDGATLDVPVQGYSKPSVTFSAAAGGQIAFQLINAPRAHIDLPDVLSHTAGKEVEHIHGYYDLLAPGSKSPKVYSAHEVKGAKEPAAMSCPLKPLELKGKKISFIDPINCSIGDGCPTDDPC